MIPKHTLDFLFSFQKRALKDYTAFWDSFGEEHIHIRSEMDKMSKTIASMQKLSRVAQAALSPPMPSMVSLVHSQVKLLSSEFKASERLVNTLTDFNASMKSSIHMLSKLSPSAIDTIGDIRRSIGCSAYLFNVIGRQSSMDLKRSGASDFMVRLLGVGKQHDIFVNKTIRRLQGESSGPVFDKLVRSVDLEKNQMLSTISTLSRLLPEIETYSAMPPPCTLNLPDIQQNEILEIDLDSDTLAPSTELSFEIGANIGILLKCKEMALPVDGKALISNTDKILVSVNELPRVVAVDETTLGQFIDHLFFLFYKGAGSTNLRFVRKYGGVLEESDCGFIWRLKHMRNLWLRHDYQHGKLTDIERKKKELQDDLTYYGLSRKPRSTQEFRQLQVNMVKDMATFVSTLEAAILKS